MIARGITDFTTLGTAQTQSAKLSMTIKQQRRRLEGLLIQVTGPAITATLTTPATESFGRMLKRVRVKVNDVAGSRFVADVEGVAILDEWLQMGGALPWPSVVSYGNTGASLSAFTPRIIYPLFFRHPQLEEPSGNLTSIPLYELREDLQVEVELGTNAEVAAANFTHATTVRVKPIYRDTVGGDYIPSEIISSDRDSLPASSQHGIEIPSNGLLTSVLVQTYSSTAKTTRQSLVSSSGDPDVSLYYGRELIRRENPILLQDSMALTTASPIVCSGTAVTLATIDHSFLIDLMDDLPLIGAFSARSGLNLTSIRAGGDTCRLLISSTNSTSPCVRMTTRKFLGGPVDLIQLG